MVTIRTASCALCPHTKCVDVVHVIHSVNIHCSSMQH
jgi:hypothetical protein